MLPKEFIKRWRDKKDQLKATRRDRGNRIVLDLIGQIRLRVRSSGVSPDGIPFPDYTPAYERERARLGFQVAFVDITRSGRTLNSIQPEVVAEDDNKIVIEAAPRTARGQKILRGLSGKRPRINYPSDQEIQIALKSWEEEFFNILKS